MERHYEMADIFLKIMIALVTLFINIAIVVTVEYLTGMNNEKFENLLFIPLAIIVVIETLCCTIFANVMFMLVFTSNFWLLKTKLEIKEEDSQ